MALFLIFGIAAVVGVSGFIQTNRLKTALRRQKAAQHIPMAIEVVILTAQAGELVRVVENASIVNITAVLLLLAIVLAARLGTEDIET
jgi:hypothetical protein